jgi:hypothetical protein
VAEVERLLQVGEGALAETADGIVPWPVTTITSVSAAARLARARISSPPMSVIMRSVTTTSNISWSIRRAPSEPLPTTVTS